MFNHDYELEKHYHQENFEPDYDTINDLYAELDNDDAKEKELIRLANENEKEIWMTERMDKIEDQKFRWGTPKGQ